jgi:hypothetical protein
MLLAACMCRFKAGTQGAQRLRKERKGFPRVPCVIFAGFAFQLYFNSLDNPVYFEINFETIVSTPIAQPIKDKMLRRCHSINIRTPPDFLSTVI